MATQKRRQFLTQSGAAALTTCLGTLGASAQDARGSAEIKVGIVGLGGRGTGAVNDILSADPKTVLWSIGDIDEAATKSVIAQLKKKYGDRIQCDGRVFTGYNSFDQVSSSGIQVILLTTPPAFRPAQVKKSFEKGLHVFAEKPWCVDTPGLNMVKEAVDAANKKGLSFLTGLVWRYTPVAQKLYGAALSGELGDVINAQGYYCLWRSMNKQAPIDLNKFKSIHDFNKGGMWFDFVDLGGDWVMEQFVHSVDKLGWAMNDQLPSRCYGVGGRPYNYPVRNTTRHLNVTYEYTDGRRACLNGSHMSRFTTIHDEVFTTKGMTRLDHGRAYIKKDGKMVYQANSVPLGYQNEHKIFMQHIRAGKVFSDIESTYNTHILAMMGRLAVYSGQEIYPEDVLESEEVFFDSEKKWDYDTPFKPRPFSCPVNFKL